MDATPERVADTRCSTGEGPVWHPDERALYWCDIPNGRLFRTTADEAGYELLLDEDDALGGATVEADGALLLFRAAGRVERFDPGEGDPEHVTTVESATHTRFNDVIADPEGRVYAGTMPTDDELGRLYRVESDGDGVSVDVVADGKGFDIPNGMAFTDDLETMYVTESEAHVVYAYDYDRATGDLSNPEPFVETDPDDGVPDGLTIDDDDGLWSARWNGGAVVRYGADGTERDRLSLPARKVSCPVFGGDDLRDVYVTTAGGADRPAEGDGAGALFRFEAPDGVAGRPAFRSSVATE
ncbi:SMP-30/gluconolactonase/LRE family protein [Candidatus Halobonum tyrrellensis]|uniref:SMP-30/gluconolaconase/LRE-like region-containing protein n=1 Tax=Candidatus Halobonum tyrrellensis G22 TaxID=1324957 RepID=V4HBP1_9EURY|nr:SMP-30/gluconolactonase/LRE family protein [Candidatus Halobonum tyrrellensis]ESP87463.1 SMP-30/gluconolaconase/LRE-like region-containing protein [Candidatus Halobonum tyrrellensis G22]